MDFLLSNHFVSTKVLVHIITLTSRLTLSRGATDRCITLHRDGSDFGCIQVSGYSSTYRMETAPSCYSWNDRSIGDVVKSLCSDGKVQLALNAAHKKQLDYICQYEESDFDFVRRLALQYQEWMYYDGLKLVFGKPRRLPDPIKMEFGTSLSSLNIGLQTLARPEQVFTFHSGANREMDRKTPDKAYGHDRMAGDAFRAALPSYPKAARQYSIQRVSSIDDLENYVLLKQAAETAETHYVTAESQDPRLHVGSVISLYSSFLKGVGNLSQESLGDFIIIEMTHEVSESCYYKNRFKAIPGTVMSLPNPKVEMPLAETQMATVLSNADPHGAGRVQVRMNWQTDNMRTSWVRVMTPDGGGSKDVKSNRGFVFIPEVGDQVLLGFRHGDPARPYVMGSLFNGTTGGGGGQGNNCKSLTSRTGSTLKLDDSTGNVLLADKTGQNLISFDGNNTVTVSAVTNIHLDNGKASIKIEGDTITIKAKTICIDGATSTTCQSGENESVVITSGTGVDIQGANINAIAKSNVEVSGGSKSTLSSPSTSINGDGDVTITGGLVKINS